MTTPLIERYQSVLNRIETASEKYHRIDSVKLLAVSKTKPIEDIIELAKAGQNAFGENYLQEALSKIEQMPHLEWHFIGPIQSNKTKQIAENFQWVHSVDRLKIAQRLSSQRPEQLPPLQILLEVNVSDESSKAGFQPEDLLSIADEVIKLPNIQLRGLMAIPARANNFESQCKPFHQLKQLLEALQDKYPKATLDTLSMGMSADLEAAISEGATYVRIGTDIFGARNYS